jgi:hypothetical protein
MYWQCNQSEMGGNMKVRLLLLTMILLVGTSSFAQSPIQEYEDEKEPELRGELVRMVTDDQNIRGEFDKFRRAHGLFLDNKTLNEKLNNDPELKKGFMSIAMRMQLSDDVRLIRIQQIFAKYGWPGRSLVGTEAAAAAWLMIQHSDTDVAFQRAALEAMKKLPPCEVVPTHLAELTDRVLLNKGKKQLYGTMLVRIANGTLVPKPIEDEANVDKRRAELGLLPLAEYLRRSKDILGKSGGDKEEPEPREELMRLAKDDQDIRGKFDRLRTEHGLWGLDNKTLDEKLNKDPELKKEYMALSSQMQELNNSILLPMKKIVAKYGWPGRSLVGTEAARAAWLIVLHADSDAVFQRNALELVKTLPAGEVENVHIAYLTDRTLINEELIYKDGKKQVYGTILINENGKLVPKPIWEEANVDKRRAEFGLEPLAEYIRRQTKALLKK